MKATPVGGGREVLMGGSVQEPDWVMPSVEGGREGGRGRREEGREGGSTDTYEVFAVKVFYFCINTAASTQHKHVPALGGVMPYATHTTFALPHNTLSVALGTNCTWAAYQGEGEK